MYAYSFDLGDDGAVENVVVRAENVRGAWAAVVARMQCERVESVTLTSVIEIPE